MKEAVQAVVDAAGNKTVDKITFNEYSKNRKRL